MDSHRKRVLSSDHSASELLMSRSSSLCFVDLACLKSAYSVQPPLRYCNLSLAGDKNSEAGAARWMGLHILVRNRSPVRSLNPCYLLCVLGNFI